MLLLYCIVLYCIVSVFKQHLNIWIKNFIVRFPLEPVLSLYSTLWRHLHSVAFSFYLHICLMDLKLGRRQCNKREVGNCVLFTYECRRYGRLRSGSFLRHWVWSLLQLHNMQDFLVNPLGGSVAEWLACWTQAQKGLGSNRSRDAVW